MEEDTELKLEDNIGCLVSIGTGMPALTGYQDQGVKAMMETLVRIATDCEDAAEQFKRQHMRMVRDKRFFRFNVDRGLENIGLEEWKRLDDIKAATRNYAQLEGVRIEMDTCSQVLKERESASQYA